MGMLHKGKPLGARHIDNMHLAISSLRRVRAPKDVGSCIGGMVQHPQHIMMLDLSPDKFSLPAARSERAWERADALDESGVQS